MLNNHQKWSIREKLSRSSWTKKKEYGSVDMVLLYEKFTNKQPRRSGRAYIGVCPFPDHQDTTPSFAMYPDTNSYHCFGCDRNGSSTWLKRELERIYQNGSIRKDEI